MRKTRLLMRSLILASSLFISATPTNASAQTGPAGTDSSRSTHQLEALAEAGVGLPRFWSGTPTNEHVGTSITGSLLVYLGRGCSAGIAAEWTRLSWTTNSWPPYSGQRAHFDTIIVGPEGRFTFNQNGNILPHIYAGLGIGSLSVSATDLGGKLSGGPAARAGIGIDYRLMPRLRIGVSAGVSLMPTGITASMGPPGYLGPGVPTDPGNIWSLRLGARGEFL